ncbi:sulfite exporter TauE/SafE family protein [uncultured Prevotella sp.]|uniref:sulfite exporter TauE/SafE family protein n=1 Tax=uncultured Prevotella sp. TaxID=159272 RepID=UPI002634B831|nr:sulfite exporter TauE/SafE family protein [uncultured Prevotella sp.]
MIIEIFLLSIGASFVQRTTGFGFGIFIMTMLPAIMSSHGEATTLSGILAMTTSLIIVIQKYRFIVWRRLLPILLTFIVVSIGAIFVLKRMEYSILNMLLGITLVVVSIYFSFFSKRIKVKTTLPVQITAGTLSGLMGGFFGMQGPPAVLYFVNSEKDKEHYLAVTQTYFLVGNIMMTIARAYNGFFTTAVSMGYIYGITGVVIGNLIGAWVFRHITGSLLKYIIYAYIGISGLTFLFEA